MDGHMGRQTDRWFKYTLENIRFSGVKISSLPSTWCPNVSFSSFLNLFSMSLFPRMFVRVQKVNWKIKVRINFLYFMKCFCGQHPWKHQQMFEVFSHNALNTHKDQSHTFNSLINNNILDVSICKQHNRCCWNVLISLWYSRKHCGKRCKCWLWESSPFQTMILTGFFPTNINRWHSVIKDLICCQEGFPFGQIQRSVVL